MRFLRAASTCLIVCIATGTNLSAVAAQDNANAECLTQIYASFSREQRIMRAVIYGQPSPADLPVGATLYGQTAKPLEPAVWMKKGPNEWRSTLPEMRNLNNIAMAGVQEVDPVCTAQPASPLCVRMPRRGILETRKAATSELIPPILQSMRAFQCRLRAVCMIATESMKENTPAFVLVQPPGCEQIPMPTMPSCKITEASRVDVAFQACEAARISMLKHEMSVIEEAIAYDASYRSLAQFRGIFDSLFPLLRTSILQPLLEATKSMSRFRGLPCFLSQCDE